MSDEFTFSGFEEIQSLKKGMLLVDKPIGPTSHDVVAWARKVFQVRKIGHTGTLDPLASGLLILLISRDYTKLQAQLLKQDKTYRVTAALGITSDTYDCTGTVTPSGVAVHPTDSQLRVVLDQFIGDIDQEVPAFSAVKVGGKKLYKIARRNLATLPQLPSRKVVISNIELIEYAWPNVTLRIDCSSGTYVRSLISDLGKVLNVGAMVTSLRRERIGTFTVEQASVCPYFISRYRSPLTIETSLGGIKQR
jgi:tRNA pseudouridine55 synthase